jgi:hypothetical protein
MGNVNSWLLALSFLLGLVITLAFMIRRVKREVPKYGSGGAARLTGGAEGAVKTADVDADASTAKAPKISTGGAVAAGAAGAEGASKLVGGTHDDETAKFSAADDSDASTAKFAAPASDSDASTAKLAAVGGAGLAAGAVAAGAAVHEGAKSDGDEPYGAGSLRGATAPSGWTIKGNEDSMLYHTTDSPSYKRTIAEVWFFDEETARKAGFTHWREGRKKPTGAAKLVATEPEVPPGPFGAGSTTPAADGSGPAGWTVKGNADSMLYHSQESPSYAVTVAEVWFRDVATAEAAGFNRWDSGKSQRGKH